MPHHHITVRCPVHRSFRVEQVAGMFDLPVSEDVRETFDIEVPSIDDDWQIGLIVGPSGSGKSTVAGEAFGNRLYEPGNWPNDCAVIDALRDVPVRDAVAMFTAVGFSSPPAWVKPYVVLSGGEQFRCDLARALLETCSSSQEYPRSPQVAPATRSPQASRRADLRRVSRRGDRILGAKTGAGDPLVVFDEFTSVVDRNVAKICSAAIAKGIRRGHICRRFVAITCHYDVAEWLEPDWILDMATSRLERRRLRRPKIELAIHRCEHATWRLFARHHYLSVSLARSARCYLATWNDDPVTFCATLPIVGCRDHRRFTRIVTLPDYQGVGIGMRVVAAVAQLHRDQGLRINVTSSHPALIRHCRNSPLWRTISVRKAGSNRRQQGKLSNYKGFVGRATVSFEFLGGTR